jgi:signal transduction histidine kinase
MTKEGETAKITVSDQGIGISPQAQGHIFDRFYRSDEARAHSPKGTGLGLAICKWIAEAHHGRITVESTPGHGSRFSVMLPLASS